MLSVVFFFHPLFGPAMCGGGLDFLKKNLIRGVLGGGGGGWW